MKKMKSFLLAGFTISSLISYAQQPFEEKSELQKIEYILFEEGSLFYLDTLKAYMEEDGQSSIDIHMRIRHYLPIGRLISNAYLTWYYRNSDPGMDTLLFTKYDPLYSRSDLKTFSYDTEKYWLGLDPGFHRAIFNMLLRDEGMSRERLLSLLTWSLPYTSDSLQRVFLNAHTDFLPVKALQFRAKLDTIMNRDYVRFCNKPNKQVTDQLLVILREHSKDITPAKRETIKELLNYTIWQSESPIYAEFLLKKLRGKKDRVAQNLLIELVVEEFEEYWEVEQFVELKEKRTRREI
ncbi:MAG: hypothetical protein ACI837_000595 [Crocinitomicaceae bacterium]|jgi:hypothetical protein